MTFMDIRFSLAVKFMDIMLGPCVSSNKTSEGLAFKFSHRLRDLFPRLWTIYMKRISFPIIHCLKYLSLVDGTESIQHG